jgi:hypothetical protein
LRSPRLADLDRLWLETKGRIAEANDRGEKTLLLFFYSGHADGGALHFGNERLPLAALKERLKGGPATTTVAIVDACQNDRTPRAASKGVVRAPPFAWPNQEPAMPGGFVYLSSAARGEVAQESDDLQGSLFTHHILSGMRGSADRDRDGVVTLSELYAYGHARTLSDTHARAMAVQHSELEVQLAGQGNLIIAYPSRSTAVLALDNDLFGYLLIVDDRTGRIIGEYHRARGGATRFAVAPGLYRVQLRRKGDVRTGLVRARHGVNRLRLRQLERQATVAILTKGAQYDPYPWVVSANGVIASAAVEGFGVAYGVGASALWRVARRNRVGLGVRACFGGGSNALWVYDLFELRASALWDWEMPMRHLAVKLGVRLGVLAVHQAGHRRQSAREARLVDAPLQRTDAGAGPWAAVTLGLEIPLWSRIALNLFAEPSAHLLSVDNELSVRWSLAGLAGLGIRI